MRKDIFVDGLKKETFKLDETEEKIVLKEELNIDSHLKHNKELLNQDDGPKNIMVPIIGGLYLKKFKKILWKKN